MTTELDQHTEIPNGDYERARRSLLLSNGDRAFVDTTNHVPELVRATVDMYFEIFIDPALARAKNKVI